MQTVLLIEQKASVRQELTLLLEKAELRVEPAEDTAAARSILQAASIDLAIASNSGTEDMDVDLVQWLRRTLGSAAIPILALSIDASVHARLSAMAAGANDHISWPFSPDHFLSRVRTLLNRRVCLPSVSPQGFARRILVVDDSPTYGNALMEELQKDGHDVALAETGTDALNFLERHRADLVILDVFLPDINGIEVCRRIRASRRNAALPVLLLTGREKTVVRAEAAAARADDFAVKSRDLETIRGKVRRLLVRVAPRTISSTEVRAVDGESTALPRSPSSGRLLAAEPTALPRSPSSGKLLAAEPTAPPRSPSSGKLLAVEPESTSVRRPYTTNIAHSGASAQDRAFSPSSQNRIAKSVGVLATSQRSLAAAQVTVASTVQDPSTRLLSSTRMPIAAPVTPTTLDGLELFNRIVQGTGLSELLARSTVESVCRRLELVPSSLTAQDVPRIIAGLERTLQLFLPPDEATVRLKALSALGQ